ncbi:MAG: substrate-binding domain-containing protein [Chloroflexota bacterium]
MKKFCFLLFVFSLSACVSATPAPQAAPLRVQYTFTAQPWLADMYDCAGGNVVSAELRAAEYLDLSSVDLALRIGDANVTSPTYQIDTDEILVIINPQNPINSLTADEVLGLFTGSIQNWQEVNSDDAPVQVWVFVAGEDVQQIFAQTALGGAPVTSLARLAPGPEEMAQAIAEDVNAVGILTQSWKAENVSAVYTVAIVPVLVLSPDEPQGISNDIIACLQK